MCEAMGRDILNVILGGAGEEAPTLDNHLNLSGFCCISEAAWQRVQIIVTEVFTHTDSSP